MRRSAGGAGLGLLVSVLLGSGAAVWAHGDRPDLASYGNFADSSTVCQRTIGEAGRACLDRATFAQRRCMEVQMAGADCDTAARDAQIEAAKQTARDRIAASCDAVAVSVLGFGSLDDAQTDITNACDAEATAAISVMYGPVGSGAVSAPPAGDAGCVREAAYQAHKLIRFSLRQRHAGLDRIAGHNMALSNKQALMARTTMRIARVRQLVEAKIAAACSGSQFSGLYGKSIDAFLDLVEARANCMTASGYVQGSVTCPQPVCGNGAKEPGEECDDGNSIDDDACHNNCTRTQCNFFPTTYGLIQAAIFESKGCTNNTCHGSGTSGGLDLRRGGSYDHLVDVPSTSSPLKRVYPGDKDLSLLWRKLAAATLGNIPDLPGGPMPAGGLPALTQNELEAVRLWVYSGAPRTGVVNGVANLLDACAPPADPIQIPPPDPPPPGAGVQMHMPQVALPPKSETERCFASYYDFTDQVPPELRTSNGTFRFKKRVETQDPLSHHLIIHAYLGEYGTDDPAWGPWTCKGGASAGQPCTPTDVHACAPDGVCGSEPKVSVACLGYGPPDYSARTAPAFGGSQEPVAVTNWFPGVYEELPLKGIVVWNSHSFNLTQRPAKVEAWVNFDFAQPAEQRYAVQGGILDPDNKIFIMDVPPFERKRYCYHFTFPRGARLFEVTSHMHKRGKLFQIYAPNGTPDGELIYNSTQYNDPVQLTFAAPRPLDSADPADRTYRYCAEYDNGFTDPAEVKRKSTSPRPPNGLPIGGPCLTPVACTDGLVGSACRGNGQAARDRSCDTSLGAGDGGCDACPLKGGVTTEDEMLLFIAYFYCDGTFPDTCKDGYTDLFPMQ